jgi:hypothetical protein
VSRADLIAERWRVFEESTLRGASRVQRDEMRKAFFFGALALFDLLMNALAPGAEPTDSDLAIMDGINEELRGFVKRETT